MLYVIIGPSSSGKTSSRRHITKKYGISGIDTDTLRTMAASLLPDINVGHAQTVKTNYENMRPVISAFLYARSFFEEDYLIEGDAINLKDIKEYKERYGIKCLVLGYPHDTAEERLNVFNNAETSHWSHDIPQAMLRQKVTENIQHSRFLMREAERLGLPFLEVSSHNTINENIQKITTYLME